MGKVFPREVLEYKKAINPSISYDLNRTFFAKFDIPKAGIAMGLMA